MALDLEDDELTEEQKAAQRRPPPPPPADTSGPIGQPIVAPQPQVGALPAASYNPEPAAVGTPPKYDSGQPSIGTPLQTQSTPPPPDMSMAPENTTGNPLTIGQPIARPMAPRPAGERYESLAAQGAPEYHGWKRFADTLAGATNIGTAIERAGGFGTQGYEAKLGRAEKEAKGENERIAETGTEAERNATTEQREALAEQERQKAAALARGPVTKPGKPTVLKDAQGNVAGFVDEKGDLIGPNSPNLTPEMKDIMANSQGKAPKHQPGEVRLNEGIPDGVYGENDKLWRAGDPNIPPELKASLDDAMKAHQKHFQEQQQVATAGRSVYAGARAVNVVTPDNVVHAVDGLDLPEFIRSHPGSVVESGTVARQGQATALVNDIRVSANNVRNTLDVLDRKGFDYAKLAAALASPDSTAAAYLQSIPREQLDDRAQQFVTDIFNLREQAMSLRSVLGAGQGSEDLRRAILATLPGVASGSSGFGQKQLDNLEGVLARVERGIQVVPQRPATETRGELQPPGEPKAGMKWQHRTTNGKVEWRQVPQ